MSAILLIGWAFFSVVRFVHPLNEDAFLKLDAYQQIKNKDIYGEFYNDTKDIPKVETEEKGSLLFLVLFVILMISCLCIILLTSVQAFFVGYSSYNTPYALYPVLNNSFLLNLQCSSNISATLPTLILDSDIGQISIYFQHFINQMSNLTILCRQIFT